MNRLEAAVRAKGLRVFAHIDHAAGADGEGMPLRPTDMLVFGAARDSTPLLQSAQTAGIDLPLRALVWQDESGKTWLGYNDPGWIAARHAVGGQAHPTVVMLAALLEELAKTAAS